MNKEKSIKKDANRTYIQSGVACTGLMDPLLCPDSLSEKSLPQWGTNRRSCHWTGLRVRPLGAGSSLGPPYASPQSPGPILSADSFVPNKFCLLQKQDVTVHECKSHLQAAVTKASCLHTRFSGNGGTTKTDRWLTNNF